MASFDIKSHFWISIFVKLTSILHNQNINLLKHIGLDGKHTINSADQGHVICFFEMLDHTFKNLEHCRLFIASHGFNDEFVITGKEEEGSWFSSALSWFEDVV